MRFSKEAKDFISGFKASSGVMANLAHAKYYGALAKKLDKPDPIAALQAKGAQQTDSFARILAQPNTDTRQVKDEDYAPPGLNDGAGPLQAADKPAVPAEPSPTDTAAGPDVKPEADDTSPGGDAATEASEGALSGISDPGGEEAMYLAEGGVVPDDEDQPSAIPADEPANDPVVMADRDAESGAPAAEAPGAAPADEAAPDAPATSNGDPKDDGLLGLALHGTIDWIKRTTGLDRGGPDQEGALPTAAPHPGVRYLAGNLGAADAQEAEDVYRKIDPNNKLDPAIRNIGGLKAVYDYYLTRGDVDKAQKAAASMVMYLRNVSAEFAGNAEAAIKRGDFGKGVEFLQQSYNNLPDGYSYEVKLGDGGRGFFVKRDADGNVVGQGPFTPQQLLATATGMKDGTLFWKQIMQSAHKNLGETGEPNREAEALLRQAYGINEDMTVQDDPGLAQGGAGQGQEAVPTAGGASSGNASPGASAGPPGPGPGGVSTPQTSTDMPQPPQLEKQRTPDTQMLARLMAKDPKQATAVRAEFAKANSAIAARNKAAVADYQKRLAAWREQTGMDAMQEGTRALNEQGYPEQEQAVPTENTGRDYNDMDDPAASNPTQFGPAGAVTDMATGQRQLAHPSRLDTADSNSIGVDSADPSQSQQPLQRPPRVQYDEKLMSRMTPAQRTQYRLMVDKKNAQLEAEYKDRAAQQKAAGTAARQGQPKADNLRIKDRGDVVAQINDAFDGLPDTQRTDKPEAAQALKDGAFHIFQSNNMSPHEAVYTASEIVTVNDPKNPARIAWKAQAMPDGSGAHIMFNDGRQVFVDRNTLQRLAMVRAANIKDAQSALDAQANTDREHAKTAAKGEKVAAEQAQRREDNRRAPVYTPGSMARTAAGSIEQHEARTPGPRTNPGVTAARAVGRAASAVGGAVGNTLSSAGRALTQDYDGKPPRDIAAETEARRSQNRTRPAPTTGAMGRAAGRSIERHEASTAPRRNYTERIMRNVGNTLRGARRAIADDYD